MGKKNIMRELLLKAISHIDLLIASELEIQRCILREFTNNEFDNYKESYVQSFPRLKNHDPSKPDLVLKMIDEIYIIEVKLLPDKKRNSKRFERAFIDCAYLKNEINKNGVKGFFILIDRENTNYFRKNKFEELTEELLNIKLNVIINWERISGINSVVVFMTEVYCP